MNSPQEPTLPPPLHQSSNPAAVSTPTSSSFATGSKRPAPSLLPPFEPLSSSPALPRPLKRQNTGNGFGDGRLGANSGAGGSGNAYLKYPTPVPTSSTGIMSSSPPRGHAPTTHFHARDAVPSQSQQHGRPSLIRTSSERAPLSAVPSLELPENGDPVMMGRSSNSSHYQLSANRLVSRVHVKARYVPSQDGGVNKIEIICNGWNGLKLHCQGRTWELFKGDSFTSETEGTDVMMDVQDARVMIQWPKRGLEALAHLSDSSWDDSPRSQARANALMSSPLRRPARIQSPESPTPAHLSSSQRLQALLPDDRDDGIQIYEDEPELPEPKREEVDVNESMRTEVTASFSSDLSDPEEHDPDEENDPIVHSFGPFGADIAGRMASISTKSPRTLKPPGRIPGRGHPVSTTEKLTPHVNIETPQLPDSGSNSLSPPPMEETPTPSPSIEIDPAITNHVINQLAFSRLSSTPLPTIMQNLPVEDRKGLTREELRLAIEATPAIGIIERQGKDAAGKALESEYYYVPEADDDVQRRAAVVDGLRKPSLRNCRKQHKQYYWKRPRTP